MNVVTVVLGIAAAAAVVGAFLVTPADRRRGLAGLLGVALLVFGASATAPAGVQAAAQLGAVVLMLVGVAVGGGVRVRQVRGVLVTLVLFAVVVLVVTQIAYPVGTIAFAKLMAVALATLLCFAGFSQADRSFFLAGLVGLAAVEAALGFVEFLVTRSPVPWGFKVRADGSTSALVNPLLPGSTLRVSGSLGHPIPFATLLGLGILVVVAGWRRWGAARGTLVVVVLGVAILLSGSRSVIIGTVIGAALLVWSSSRSGRAVRVFGMVAVAVVGAVVFAGDIAALVGRLVDSGSYTNRAGALDAVPALLGRAPLESLFGSGFASDFELYHRGFFPQNGFLVIDNQFVTTLGTEGIVGVVLLITLLVLGWLRGGRLMRAWLALFVVMLFSFDYLGWFAMLAMLVVTLVLPDEQPPADVDTRRALDTAAAD